MFGFLLLLDFVLCVSGHSHRKFVLSPGSVSVYRVEALTGFANVWISACSAFVLCVCGIAILNPFFPWFSFFFVSCLGARRIRKYLDFCVFKICFVRRWP